MVQQGVIIEGEVVAENVSFDEYMEKYAEHFAEWVDGKVIKLSPVTEIHDLLSRFFVLLLTFYMNRTKEGKFKAAPFVMRTRPDVPGREPDLHIVLTERTHIFSETMTDGPADIAIEIVSKESRVRDTIDKFDEYRDGGVREYWVIDPERRQPDFYALGDDGLYKRIELRNGVFRSTVLSRFRLDTAVLWQQDKLEDDEFIRELVKEMVKEN